MLKSLSTELKAAGFISQEQYEVIQLFRSKNPAESSIGPLLAVGDLNEQQVQSFIMQKTRAKAAPHNLLECLERLKKEACPLNSEMLQHFEIIPVSWDSERLELAVADPLNKTRMAQIEFLADRKVTFCVATQSAVSKALQQFYPNYKVSSKPWEHLKSLTKASPKQPEPRKDSWHGASGPKAAPQQAFVKPAPQPHMQELEKQTSLTLEAKANALFDEDENDEVITPSPESNDPVVESAPEHSIDEIVSMDGESPFQTLESETSQEEKIELSPVEASSDNFSPDEEALGASEPDQPILRNAELDVNEIDEPMVDTADLEDDIFGSESSDDLMSADGDLNESEISPDNSFEANSDIPYEGGLSENIGEPDAFADSESNLESEPIALPVQDFAQQVSRLNMVMTRLPLKLNLDSIDETLESNAQTLDQALILALSQKNDEPHFYIANFPGSLSIDRIKEEISETIITQWNSSERSVRPIEVQLGPYTYFKAAFSTNSTHHACLMLPWSETQEDSEYLDNLLVRLTSKILERFEFN